MHLLYQPQRKTIMNQTSLKAIFNTRNKVIGEIFETESNNFGFYHSGTATTQAGFADFEAALNAWHCFHDEWFENLPR